MSPIDGLNIKSIINYQYVFGIQAQSIMESFSKFLVVIKFWNISRLQKLKDTEGMAIAANAVNMKTDLLLKFLSNDDDEVSQAVTEFAREYLQFLKNKANAGVYGVSDSKNVEVNINICLYSYVLLLNWKLI